MAEPELPRVLTPLAGRLDALVARDPMAMAALEAELDTAAALGADRAALSQEVVAYLKAHRMRTGKATLLDELEAAAGRPLAWGGGAVHEPQSGVAPEAWPQWYPARRAAELGTAHGREVTARVTVRGEGWVRLAIPRAVPLSPAIPGNGALVVGPLVPPWPQPPWLLLGLVGLGAAGLVILWWTSRRRVEA